MKRKAMRCLFEIAKEGNYSTNLLHVQLHSRERIRNCIQITEKKPATHRRERKKKMPNQQTNQITGITQRSIDRHNQHMRPSTPHTPTSHLSFALKMHFFVCIFFLLFLFLMHTPRQYAYACGALCCH